MEENTKLSPQEVEVNKVVNEACRDIAKLESDIKKLGDRGVLQLNYNPPGMRSVNQQHLRDKEKLENNIKTIKADTIKTTDQITQSLPFEQQRTIRQEVLVKLYPEVDQKQLELIGKEKKDMSSSQEYLNQRGADNVRENKPEQVNQKEQPAPSISTRFGQSLNHSKFLSKEKSPDIGKEKDTGKDDR